MLSIFEFMRLEKFMVDELGSLVGVIIGVVSILLKWSEIELSFRNKYNICRVKVLGNRVNWLTDGKDWYYMMIIFIRLKENGI